jgi:hypothetical protein
MKILNKQGLTGLLVVAGLVMGAQVGASRWQQDAPYLDCFHDGVAFGSTPSVYYSCELLHQISFEIGVSDPDASGQDQHPQGDPTDCLITHEVIHP